VLNGFADYLNKEFIDFIQLEYGVCNMNSRITLLDLFDLLSEKGFVLHKIMLDHLEPRAGQTFMENYLYQNYVAISDRIVGDLVG